MSDWRATTIGALCDDGDAELQTGPFGTQLHAYDYVDAGVPVVPTEAIRDRQIERSVLPKISTTKASELSRHLLKTGDILFARRGVQATGHVAYVREGESGFICGTGAIRLRIRERSRQIDHGFLSHVLANPASVKWFKFHAIGATMPNLNEGIIRSFPLLIPSLSEQHAINVILSALDDKIEINRRMNKTLEAMARALFKSWFVDFDAVRAKVEGRDPQLSKQVADLFPDSFESSESGDIPRGWGVASLREHFDAMKGVSYKGSGLSNAGMPLHNLNSVYEGGGYKYDGIKYYNGEYAERHMLVPGDVIVANTEQGHDRLLIGYAAVVPRFFGENGIASHHIYRLRPKGSTPLTSTYLCQLLNTPVMHDVVSGYANGTTVNMLPVAGVQQPLIVIPPHKLIDKFERLARITESRREGIVVESRTLASIRDALLPKLVSGELRVKDGERFVESAF